MFSTFNIPNLTDRLAICMSGREALAKIDEDLKRDGSSTYSLILTDLSMPGMDGYKFISKLRKKLGKCGISREV